MTTPSNRDHDVPAVVAADPAEADPGMRSSGLVSGRLLAHNSLLNLVTSSAVLIGNVVFIPAMLRTFGMELYGVLSVTWMVLGHMRFLDLGFSAACAKYVARDLAAGREDDAGRWAWTAVAVQVLLGTAAALVLWWGAPYLADLLKIDPQRRPMVVLALRMFAVVVPVDLAARSFSAVLEAKQRFDWVNGLTIFGAVWTYSSYALGILRDGDFQLVVVGLVSLRIVNLVLTCWLAGRALPSVRFRAASTRLVDGARLREMFRFGGWVSISNGIGPLIFFFDRWVISSVRAVSVLPLYTVPLQMLTSLQTIPVSMSSTLLPAFSVLEANTQWDRMQNVLVRAHRYLLLALIPILGVLFLWAPEILRLWIDQQFASQATLPFRILIIGFSIGLFAPFSGALLQGAGRPDILSKVYLVEFPVNVVVTVILVRQFGVVGAAITYTIRTVVETFILWVCIHKVFPLSWRMSIRGTLQRLTPVVVGSSLLAIALPPANVASVAAVGMTLTALLAYGLVVRFHLLDESDRVFIRGILARTRSRLHDDGPRAV